MDDFLRQVVSVVDDAIKRKKTNVTRASVEAVGNVSLIRNMKMGKSPRLNNLKRLCDVLDLQIYVGRAEDFGGPTNAKILGETEGEIVKIRASGDEIPSPVGKDSIMACKIGDNHLFPVFSAGDIAFVDEADTCDPAEWEEFIGNICMVKLPDRAVRLCILRRGDNPKMFNLESLAGKPTLSDQTPVSCLPIRWVRKAGS